MSKQTGWLGAAETLPPSTVHAVIARLSRVAKDEAVEGAALPDALLAVASGHPIGTACRLAVRTAVIDLRRSEAARAQREAEYATLSAGEDTPTLVHPSWERVREAIPFRATHALDSLAGHLLRTPRIWERLASGSVKINGAVCLDALGVSTDGKSKRAVQDMRRAALLVMCASWAEASVALGNTPEADKTLRADRAYRWVKRGHSNRFGRVQGAADGTEVRVTRRVSVSAGFTAPNDGEPVRSVSYRPTAPVKRIRSPRTTDGVAEGIVWGGGGAVGMPSRETRQTLGHSDRRQASQDGAYVGWVRHTRDDIAAQRTEREDWERAVMAGRVGICPTVDDKGICQCPRTRTRNHPCAVVTTETRDDFVTRTERARLRGEDAPKPQVVYLHPLSPCKTPTQDGRCGCSRKAGVLVWAAPSPEAPGALYHPSQPRRTR